MSVATATLQDVDAASRRWSPELDERSRALLDFERERWRQPRPRDRAVRERFGVSAVRYQQLLNRLIDQPAALAYDPVLVLHLRSLRESRRRRRRSSPLSPPR
jgi:hypothetical protein